MIAVETVFCGGLEDVMDLKITTLQNATTGACSGMLTLTWTVGCIHTTNDK